MRLTRGSMALWLLQIIAWCGNFSYSTLRIFPENYESLKDAIQKLKRAGYIRPIKTSPGQSLYITLAGKNALCEKQDKLNEPASLFRDIEYTPGKARRSGLINETLLLFHQASQSLSDYLRSSRDVRWEMGNNIPRSSDLIKYSRFAAVWQQQRDILAIYNFGDSNRTLNRNGEKNLAVVLKERFAPDGIPANRFFIRRLILAGDMCVLKSIINLSVQYAKMPKGKRGYINASGKRPFLVKTSFDEDEPESLFLPVSREVLPILRMMHDSEGWLRFIGRFANNTVPNLNKYSVINLLYCEIGPWVCVC